MANLSHASLLLWKPFLLQLRQIGATAGFDLKVRYSDRTLYLLLEGAAFSSRKRWIREIQTLLAQYPVQSIQTDQIVMYGRVQGKRYPDWKATIDLQQSIPSAPAEKSSPAQQSLPPVRPPRALRPAVKGLKDVLSLGVSSPQNLSAPRINPEIVAQLSSLGSQQWLARSILGVFLLGLMIYLYVGTWFIPRQVEKWGKLQSDLDRISTSEPRNLRDLETLTQDLTETIAQLHSFSPLAGTLYQQARSKAQSLEARQAQLQYRQTIEQQGQACLAEAKRLAAEATFMLERDRDTFSLDHSSKTEETQATAYWRSVQHHWLKALYWLNQVPGQTFAAEERYRLLQQYQRAYWQIYNDTQTIPVQW